MVIEGFIKKLIEDVDIWKKDRSEKWIKRSFLLEYDESGDGKYVEQIAFEVFGKTNERLPELRVNSKVRVVFAIKTNEWKGKDGTDKPKYFVKCAVINMEVLQLSSYGNEEYLAGGERKTELFDKTASNNTGNDMAAYTAEQKGYGSEQKEKEKEKEKVEDNDLPF